MFFKKDEKKEVFDITSKEDERNFYLDIVKENLKNFNEIPSEYQHDKDFVSDILNENMHFYVSDLRSFYNNLTDFLKKDKDIAYKYFNGFFDRLEDIPAETFKDVESFKKLYKDTGRYHSCLSKFFPEELRNDKEFFLEAIKNKDMYIIENACDEIKNDKDIALAILRYNSLGITNVSEEIKRDKEFMLNFIKENPKENKRIFYDLKELRGDKEFITEFIKITKCPAYIKDASEDVRNDKKLMSQLIPLGYMSVQYLGKELLKDSEMINDILLTDIKRFVNSESDVVKRNSFKNLTSNMDFLSKTNVFDFTSLKPEIPDIIKDIDFKSVCEEIVEVANKRARLLDQELDQKFDNSDYLYQTESIRERFLNRYNLAVKTNTLIKNDEKESITFDSLSID